MSCLEGNEVTFSNEILHGMAEAVIFADLDGLIRLWNPGAEELFGFSASEAIGQSLDIIIPEPFRAAHWKGFHHAIEEKRTHYGRRTMITRSLTKSGDTIYVDMSFALVYKPEGTVVGSVAVASDANERFLEERKLKKRLVELEAGNKV